MQRFWLFVVVLALSGCAGDSMNVRPPSVDDFPEQELPFRFAGDNDVALKEIQTFLWDRGLPSIVTVRASKTFVVTTYIEEPQKSDDRRLRRTAFRLGLTPGAPSALASCTTISVVSLTKSRGVREEIWSTQDADTTFVSSAWPELKALLEKKACK